MMEERYLLAGERIAEILKEMQEENGETKESPETENDAAAEAETEAARTAGVAAMPAAFRRYFRKMAEFLQLMQETWQFTTGGRLYLASLEELQAHNKRLYEDILPEHYETSYGNPAYAAKELSDAYGGLLSFLYAELRSIIVFAYEKDLENVVIRMEVFLEVYGSFLCSLAETGTIPGAESIREILYYFVSDYTRDTQRERCRQILDPEADFALRIVRDCDLESPEHLYYYGEYVTEDESKTWQHMQELDQTVIDLMADTYTEGYRIGFAAGNKDISKKKTVNIRYHLGFERMIRKAVENFAAMGLEPVIYRAAVSLLQGKGYARNGYCGAVPNRQYDFDHKDDQALFLDRRLTQVKLEAVKEGYEAYREQAAVMGGPALVETFGEAAPELKEKKEAPSLSREQQKLTVEYRAAAMKLQNQYISAEERSFTIIAFPMPAIGADYAEIFDEIIRINTLDYKKYQRIQQKLIDVLDRGKYVLVKGMGQNRTNMKIMLHTLTDPEKQSNFENCVADVNIPVGEVFTSPVLTGTEGTLHVSRVFLHDMEYRDLCLTFRDGRIVDYSCRNFDSEEENCKYIRENLLFHHDTLPIGEFAIGTNTTAYVVGRKYGIADKLPILIAEKTGPHFAVGDTCYSHAEEVVVYNPDGKEIIARDNECSLLRDSDPEKAYFNCHTDITIPYDELGEVSVVTDQEEVISLIEEGRFVLPGCEELNRPLLEEQPQFKE